MNRVGANIVIGTFWILVAIWMFMSGGDMEKQTSAAILVVLGLMFYWSAFKIFLNPSLAKKNKKNLVQKISDPAYKSTLTKKKK